MYHPAQVVHFRLSKILSVRSTLTPTLSAFLVKCKVLKNIYVSMSLSVSEELYHCLFYKMEARNFQETEGVI